tara:strand:- start:3365 stop:4411 length:1047 start_codon:yes stop_codon:yes gene_type:complete
MEFNSKKMNYLFHKKAIIIAEAGVNHNGDINLAFKLIEEAAQSGADIVKFQTFNTNKLTTDKAPKALYQEKNLNNKLSQYDMLKKLEISYEDHFKLIKKSKDCGIEFLSTAFDLESLDFVKSLNLKRYKIPSGDITNYPYLKKIGSFSKPIILSTGMANISEIEAAIDVLECSGTSRKEITVLHCTTEYPAPISEVNLRAMNSISSAFNVDVGYSDHTLGIEIAIAAVSLGATVIEKHLTLDRNLPGPDHKASLEPKELELMINSIRNVEKALGDGVKRTTHSEERNKIASRKSIFAKKNIKKGTIFTQENIITKRPGNGISPMKWNKIIGLISPKDFKENEPIDLYY